jgi:hypothetical protein
MKHVLDTFTAHFASHLAIDAIDDSELFARELSAFDLLPLPLFLFAQARV